MGYGITNLPNSSFYTWSLPGGDLAPEPREIVMLANDMWSAVYGSYEEITTAALGLLRQTDVLLSFGACGPYSVVSYVYTPEVGVTNPNAASVVMLISGSCGVPWNDQTVAADQSTWGGLKSLYR